MIQEGTLIIWRAGTHSREHSGERLVRLFLSSAFPFGLTQTLKNKSGELLKIGMGDYTMTPELKVAGSNPARRTT